MIKAAFVTQHESWPWERQLPTQQHVFEGVDFFASTDEAEIVFVYDALPESRFVLKRPVPVVFISSEPETVKRYAPAFLEQFDAVITADRETQHPRRIFVQAGLPWHVGCVSEKGGFLASPMTFDDFKKHEPSKTKLASVVSSNKAFTAEHRARLEFVAKLKEALGDQVDVFGRGIVDFADKRDVLDSYRYHIAIENCAIENYWTEKLADPFLTLTFPIYHGCPNITDYFPQDALRMINIYKPDEAIETIKEVIGSDLAERSREHLLEARRRVMHEHNVFGLLARVAKQMLAPETDSMQWRARTFRSENQFMSFVESPRLWLRIQLGRLPMLRKILRSLKGWGTKKNETMRHCWMYLTDEFYRSHQRWISHNPKDEVRYQYELPLGANILDVGGYVGDFAARFVDICDANIAVFEPIPKFASQIEQRFVENTKISVYEAGLSDKDEVVEFDLDADASGVFGSTGCQKVQVNLWDAERFLSQFGTDEWHLAKLNIEGGEYALLNRLIDTGRIRTIKYLQVQFHLHVPGAREQYKQLAKRLRRTHKLQWRYPFVWESWVLRKDASKQPT